MSWKVRAYELRKALLSPVILSLLTLFAAYNLFLIAEQAPLRDEMRILNRLVDQFGWKISDEMQGDYEKYYLTRLDEMNKLTDKRSARTYEMPGDFFQYDNYKMYVIDQPDLYSSKELAMFNELRVIQNYDYLMQNIDETYAGLNMKQLAESEIAKYGLSGQAADTVKQQYVLIDERLQQLIANEEHKSLFFIGKEYNTHAMLFKTLIRTLVLQLMILIVLMSSSISNYEFEKGTHLLHYSTKRGRRLQTDKLLAALAAGTSVTIVLSGITLSAYFLLFSYDGLWLVPISSFFNWGFGMPQPYISWHSMSFVGYLTCAIALVYILQLIYTAISFAISAYVRNSYFVFGCFAILFGTILLMTNLVPKDWKLILFTGFTPFHLALNPNMWFMANSAFSSFPNYEWITAGSWSVLLLLLCVHGLRKFKRQNIN